MIMETDISLPLELWSHIISFIKVGTNDWKGLRLVCKAFSVECLYSAVKQGHPFLLKNTQEASTFRYRYIGLLYGVKVQLSKWETGRYLLETGCCTGNRPIVTGLLLYFDDHINQPSTFTMKDMELLNSLSTLDFGYASEWSGIDLEALNRIRDLRIVFCRSIKDVGALGRLDTLNLSCCNCITDVSALRNIRNLSLSGCSSIIDVSALGGVRRLNLSHTNITDVSALGNVYDLQLTYCKFIVDVSSLGHVHILNIAFCTQIFDVSSLGNVFNLNLQGCYRIEDVSCLGKVHSLCLRGCERITEVSALGGVYKLDLVGCIRVFDISALTNVHDLLLEVRASQFSCYHASVNTWSHDVWTPVLAFS